MRIKDIGVVPPLSSSLGSSERIDHRFQVLNESCVFRWLEGRTWSEHVELLYDRVHVVSFKQFHEDLHRRDFLHEVCHF